MIATPHLVDVPIPGHPYQVVVGGGVLDQLGTLVARHAPTSHAHVVSDSNVAPLYLGAVTDSLARAGIACTGGTFPAGETSKTVATWAGVLEGMARDGLDRDSVVVALGGGVVGDLAGFAAATYMRGIRVVQVPTSLLAMVDSSVGGKTAVDISLGKNLVGSFLQPSLVVADVRCLATLSADLFRDSCGEVIKHAVLADPALLDDLAARPLTDGSRDAVELADVVARNVRIKRDVVVADEREHGVRQTLNLGHTVGHAIEAASGFALGHGSCVAAGLCAVCRYAAAQGLLAATDAARVISVVEAHGLPTGTSIPADALAGFLVTDKKRHAGVTNLVVPRAIGRCEVVPISDDEATLLVASYARG